METPRILIVDDETDMLRLLKRVIGADIACDIETVSNAATALELFQQCRFDLALVDIRMPGMDGIQLLEQLHRLDPNLTIIMMTAYGAIEIAVESIKKGAYDFITKPFEQNDLIRLLQKGIERSALLRENRQLLQQIRKEETFHNFIGSSPPMQKLYETIQMISRTDVTVLITGESGTGKNLAARAIHALSPRASFPYIHVNCPTVPENILESELFGYKKGAFTHAVQDKKGLFEEADSGTICLDEIGDIPLSVQTKLLQVLEDKQIKPLGQTKSVHVNVRLIASTNRDLKARLVSREFREDLYYRLNVVNLHLPPLRDRREDVPLLVHHFLGRFAAEFNRPLKSVSPDLMRRLLDYPWEGNVRELANLIQRAVVMSSGETIQSEDIGWHQPPLPASPIAENALFSLPYHEAKQQMLEQFTVPYLHHALSQVEGNVTRAAQNCGLERQSFQQIMKKFGVRPNGQKSS
jgi:DNA-binding NtrC family response regulator